MFKENLKKKKWNCGWEKMIKAIEENKLSATIKTFMRIQLKLEIYEYERT